MIRCSSGTYIRALARDLGAALGTGGHLTALRRTAVGPYRLDQARTLQDLENQTHQTLNPERSGLTPDPPSATAAPPPATTAPAPATAPATAAPAPATTAPATSAPSAEAASQVARPIAWITPLAEAAAAAFPRLDLTADEARRLAQGARLPLPPHPALPPLSPHSALPPHPPADPSPIPQAPTPDAETWSIPGTPIAAFAPDDTLVALVTAESNSIRSLAVFVDAASAVREE